MNRLLLGAAIAAVFVPVSLVLGKNSGALPGEKGIPNNLNTGYPGCGSTGCHNPFPSSKVKFEISSPTSVTVGSTVPIQAKVSGANTTSTKGGLSLEASSGSFVAGLTTRVGTTPSKRSAITHAKSKARSWSFGFKPATTGLVEVFGAANAANGDDKVGGDAWGWYGPDASFPGTPYHIFVNAAQVFAYGTSCAGTKGKRPIIGMAKNAAINSTFQTEVHDVPPATATIVIMGFSNASFGPFRLPLDLTVFQAPGCFLRASFDLLNPVVTSGTGSARANWALPNLPGLRGTNLYFQAMTIDKAANGLGLTFSMGLRAPIQ